MRNLNLRFLSVIVALLSAWNLFVFQAAAHAAGDDSDEPVISTTPPARVQGGGNGVSLSTGVALSSGTSITHEDEIASCIKKNSPASILKKGMPKDQGAEFFAPYFECMAVAQNKEAECAAFSAKLPKLGSKGKGALDDSVRKACINNVRRLSYLQAVGSGSRKDIMTRLRLYTANEADAQNADFESFVDALMKAHQSGSTAGVQFPAEAGEATYKFVLGKAACDSMTDEHDKGQCQRNAGVLAALKEQNPALCDDADKHSCEALIGGVESCQTARQNLVEQYCANQPAYLPQPPKSKK